MTRVERQWERLVATVERLADTPDEQRDYLSGLGTQGLTDELALEFDDALQPVRHQFDVLGVQASVVVRIEALANALSAMGGAGHEWLWRPEALDGPEWSNVRAIAAEIIGALGVRGDETPDP
jgi:hypothetical protein